MIPGPSRRPGCDRPSRRAPVDKVVGGCTGLARLLTVDQETPKTGDAAFGVLARRGVSVLPDTEVLYAAVGFDADQRVTCVVGVFRSARQAQAYARAAGWRGSQVALCRLRLPWLEPGQP